MSPWEEHEDLTFKDKLLINSPWLIIVAIFGIIVLAMYAYEFSPDKLASDKAWNDKYNAVEKKITSMTCVQLQQIRLDSIAGKDVSEYSNHFGTVRDMYNALACGNHWSVWED